VNKRRTLTPSVPMLIPPHVMHFSATVRGPRKYLPGSTFGADGGQIARRMTCSIVQRKDRHQSERKPPDFPPTGDDFSVELPPNRATRSLTGAPPGCSTVQMHRFKKCLFLKDFFATENRWRREWDSNPRYGFPHTRFPSVRLKPLGHLSGCAVLKGRDDFCKGQQRGSLNFPQPIE
jgi:hypothetical protein